MLTNYLAKASNYQELINSLDSEIINEIHSLTNKKRNDLSLSIKYSLDKSSEKTRENSLSIPETNFNLNFLSNFLDSNNNFFGIFPKTLIDLLDPDISIELRIEAFQNLGQLVKQNLKENSFLKFACSFYLFVSNFLNEPYASIMVNILDIIDSLISTISGINLITDIHHSLPRLLKCFQNSCLKVREKVRIIMGKIFMIIPTSQLIPYILDELKQENWIGQVECLDLIKIMFSQLKSIYNDIDFSEKSYDINIFLQPIALINHSIPKVEKAAKTLVRFIGENIINTESFLKTLQFYLSNEDYQNVESLLKGNNINGLNLVQVNPKKKREVNKNKDGYMADNYDNYDYKQKEK